MDMMDSRARSFGSLGGRIILLGDGTELTSSEAADAEMFDHDDEDLDLDQQIHKGAVSESDDEPDSTHADALRRQREGTPAPTGAPPTTEDAKKVTPHPTTESPSSVKTEKSEDVAEAKEKKEEEKKAPASSQIPEAE
jgi:protein phosphatase 2C family protein 2/3